MAVLPDLPLSELTETPGTRTIEAGAIGDPSGQSDDGRPRYHLAIGRLAAFIGCTTAVVLAVILVLIGEAAASPHPATSQSPASGTPSANSLAGALAVLVAIAIVVTSAVVALRLVFPREGQAAEALFDDADGRSTREISGIEPDTDATTNENTGTGPRGGT